MPQYRRRRWREAMTVRLDLNGLLATAVGGDGIAEEELAALEPELVRVRETLSARRAAGTLRFANLPDDREGVRRVLAEAESVRGEFDAVVVLGIGGSALGVRAIAGALPQEAGAPRLVVADSIDPDAFGPLLGRLDLRRTLFNVISKSGETAETIAQFMIVRDRLLHELGAVDYKRHLIVTTDARQGSLRQIVNDEGFRELVIPEGVEGRFSALSSVGLFPAAVVGIDVQELIAGAAELEARRRAAESPGQDPALVLAGVLWLLATRHAKRSVVLMSYCERLAETGDWFCQLWAESLGKALDAAGRTIEFGQTPIRLGAADQHSQLQLFLEGPRDKVVLFLRVDDHAGNVDVPSTYQDLEGVGYLGGHSLGELLNAEQRATEVVLAKRGRPSATLQLPAVTPFTLGQLLYLLQMAAVGVAVLADVDPFGQPAVEDARRLAFGLMGRPGFEPAHDEVEAWLARKDPRFIV
jgi:glucose-6-phosphate isomerase